MGFKQYLVAAGLALVTGCTPLAGTVHGSDDDQPEQAYNLAAFPAPFVDGDNFDGRILVGGLRWGERFTPYAVNDALLELAHPLICSLPDNCRRDDPYFHVKNIHEGETKIHSVNSVEHRITANYVGNEPLETILNVDGVDTSTMTPGDLEVLPDGDVLGIFANKGRELPPGQVLYFIAPEAEESLMKVRVNNGEFKDFEYQGESHQVHIHEAKEEVTGFTHNGGYIGVIEGTIRRWGNSKFEINEQGRLELNREANNNLHMFVHEINEQEGYLEFYLLRNNYVDETADVPQIRSTRELDYGFDIFNQNTILIGTCNESKRFNDDYFDLHKELFNGNTCENTVHDENRTYVAGIVQGNGVVTLTVVGQTESDIVPGIKFLTDIVKSKQ